MASVRFGRAARAELRAATARYAAISTQVVARFHAAVREAQARLASLPEIYALEGDLHRVCPINRSSYTAPR